MLADDFVLDCADFVDKFRRHPSAQITAMAESAFKEGHFKSVDDSERFLRDMSKRYEVLPDGIKAAQRFVLSPMVVEAAEEFAKSQKVVQSALAHIFLPAAITWIEWRGGAAGYDKSPRHGLLLVGMGEGKIALTTGAGAYVFDSIVPDGPDRVLHEPLTFDLHDYIFEKMFSKGQPVNRADVEDVRRVGKFLVCVLALINTPRVSQLIPHDIDKKLNVARVKRGRVPLLSWHDVTIRPDVGWSPKETHEEGATGEVRRHHVRTFMRLKMGKVEIVRPHWRGNRDKGYVLHRHVVRMDGEEAGPWKGEPLPATKILRPDDFIPETDA